MSHFIFKAKKASGEIYSGEKDAADRYELYRIIRESGEEIVSVEEKKEGHGLKMNVNIGSVFGSIKTIDKINLARNLSAMLEAGLALSRALSVLERQARSKKLKDVLTDLGMQINKGLTFADALAKQGKVFPPIFISMVHAGEQSGTLAASLKAIGSQMESTYTLERRIRGALIYPAVILTAMIGIAILMFIFVVPTLLNTFTQLNVPLPPTTQIVLDLSNLIQHDGLIVALVVIIAVVALTWWSHKPSGKRTFHFLMLKMPVIGSLTQEVNTARTARTLSSLLQSGVDVVESVTITAQVVQNFYFRAVLEKAKEAIKKGDLMSKTFNENTKLYPVFFAEMMSVGEETGKMGEMLLNVAKYYEDDVEVKTKDMSTIIEPVLMIIIGAAVGFFAVSMITPMYSLVNAF